MIVVGAGVIGLAVARALCLAGRSVIVVERHDMSGTETTSRNSGVIHSGIYYPTGSAKAALCVRGRHLLYDYCASRHVPHSRCGKLIVAQTSEVPRLENLKRTADRNGVTDLQWLDADGIREKEPAVRSTAALWCPSTGIVSAHDLTVAMTGDIENAGGLLALRTEFLEARTDGEGFVVNLRSDGELAELACAGLVNSAGLAAVGLLSRVDGYPQQRLRQPYFAKGNYFEYSGKSPFRHLIYPMPNEAGLGIHATIDLGGQLRFGPDVEWLDSSDEKFDYAVDPSRGDKFYAAIREYWPDLADGSLRSSYSGIRPKLVGPGSAAADFCIEAQSEHGVPGLVNLLGMESPGLTSSLAVAEEVARLMA